MHDMIRTLYGNFKINNRTDYLFIVFKVIYVIYTLPFLLVALWYGINYYDDGAYEEYTLFKRISLNVLANMVSIITYALVFMGITG